jgi:hypothetical protein
MIVISSCKGDVFTTVVKTVSNKTLEEDDESLTTEDQ